MTDTNEFIAKFTELRANPGAIQRLILGVVEDSTNGEVRFVDPSNPVALVLETAASMGSAAMLQAEALTRKQYPSLAQTQDEIYLHMSDADYADRFALPSRTEIKIYIGKEEFQQKAVQVPGENIRKLVIPRNTSTTISDVTFSMQYPIEMRIMSHGGFQIVYDATKLSPLLTLESNIVDWRIVRLLDVDFIELTVPVQQFQIKTAYEKLSTTSGFTQTVSFENLFYYCRVYRSLPNGDWSEIKTTHTDQVYDPFVPTAVLTVYDEAVRVHIPSIYFTTNLINSELRIDVYTTKGPVIMALQDYDPREFLTRWIDLEGDDDGVYTSPFQTFANITVLATSTVNGGRLGISVEEMRERVTSYTAGHSSKPITPGQLETTLNDLGYNVVKNIDNITNRMFTASRELPTAKDALGLSLSSTDTILTVSGAGAAIISMQEKIETLSGLSTVWENGERITIAPETLYRKDNGIVKIMPQAEVESLMALSTEAKLEIINNANFLYTPFHYVLDIANNRFDCRAYYLDAPAIETKEFIAENNSAAMEVATKNYTVERIENGYRVTITTRSGDSFKALSDDQVFVQLSYTAKRESSRAYTNGTLLGTDEETGERIYQFDIITNFDINGNDEIITDSFKMFDVITVRNLPTDLFTAFDIVYIVTDYSVPGLNTSSIDGAIGRFLLPNELENIVGVMRERLWLRFGHSMKYLWNKARTVVSTAVYQKHLVDVPLLYEKDVYEKDGYGNIILSLDIDGITVITNKLHSAGDPVLDINGDPMFKHRIGDTVFDVDGNPVLMHPRVLLREFDLFFVDGNYYFVTADNDVAYRAKIPTTVVNWLNTDIKPIVSRLLENTELLFQPQATIGNIVVYGNNGDEVLISSEQSLTVTLYTTAQTYNNPELRRPITNSVTQTIANELKRSTISLTDVIKTLSVVLGDGIKGIKIEGLGGESDIEVLTLKDVSQQLVIGKRLVEGAAGEIMVEDDINVIFVNQESSR